ncbi:Mov34/MPN/PAD-1 family protein [Dictyobacter arantiisoli]|uniref:JAB1/MPN/MOV34 metalloenzyme domain-containing protein n=1 Tax=Dictyobacter arantiisoli TaxID=2014874 RepID=A0A5A5TGR9_9CHLR|nr:Mov34/MPN/PAD-1 family protein [Dictyobacter arantiisoli]GCF10770.1 hypothetical protein KDI_43340 [Dictyobacter arantiisoli]
MKQFSDARPRLVLGKRAQQALFTDISQRAQIEACGILLGAMDADGNWWIEEARALTNTADSPVYFEFDPAELLEAELAYPGQIMGVYHSHPTGFPRASNTDRANMQRVNQQEGIAWAWLIISGPFDADFQKRAHGTIATAPLIAYFHPDNHDLQRIPLILSEDDAPLPPTK